MKPAIVFFDIDGTLLDQDKKIPRSTVKAVQALQNKGIITAIATGRAPFMYPEIRDLLQIESFISFNGQYVVHCEEEVYKNPIPRKWLEHLNKVSEHHGHPVAYLGSKNMAATHKEHPFINRSFASLKQEIPSFNPRFHEDQDIYQALLFFEKDEEPTYLNDHEAFDTIKWHEHSMDVVPKGGTKAGGIKAMLDRLGLKPSEAVAFGDGLNDVEMLKFVEYGVAMGNGVEVAKNAARFVTKEVDQDGIVFGLKELDLI